MRELAAGVHQLRGFPPNVFNVYLIGDVLIDAGTRFARRRILRELRGRRVEAHALTHVHPDHEGSSNPVCRELGIPLWCGSGDAALMESGDIAAAQPDHLLNRLVNVLWRGAAHPVARPLREGDDVAGFTVIEVPGHSPGHVAYFRERDRVLVLGDVLANCSIFTGLPGLHDAARVFTPDPARNHSSARRLAELRPSLTLFGHGPPLRDHGRLAEFVARLPQ